MGTDRHLELGRMPWLPSLDPTDYDPYAPAPSPLEEVLEEAFGIQLYPVISGFKGLTARADRVDGSVSLVQGDVPPSSYVSPQERAIYEFHGYPATPGSADYFGASEPT